MSFHKRKFDVDGVFMNYRRISNNTIAYGTGNKHRKPAEQAEDRIQQD